jgi:uncharacterized repeat protein (TIGR01451 family)
LFSDADQDDWVSPGDTLYYEITVVNDGVGTTPQLRMADAPDPNTRLLVGSVKAIGGVIVQGNHAGDDQVTVAVTPLISGTQATVSFQVVVSSSITTTQLHNQAFITLMNPDGQPSGQAPLASDDPDTTAVADATLTPLTEPVVALRPSLFLPLVNR